MSHYLLLLKLCCMGFLGLILGYIVTSGFLLIWGFKIIIALLVQLCPF